MSTSEKNGEVHFFYESTEFLLDYPTRYQGWLHNIADFHNSKISAVNYIFCTDGYLLDINIKFLNHNFYTDIISFPYEESIENLEGDIYISIDRVRENAAENQVSFADELLRVMSHGMLHFLGYKDKTDEEAAIMRDKEEEAMRLFVT